MAISIGDALLTIGIDSKKAEAQLNTFGKKVGGVGKGLQKISTPALMAGGAIAGALGASVKIAAKFETQMANVSTMLDKNTMKNMPAFTKGIKKLSKEFGEGTDTLSTGLYNILSASVPPTKAMGVLEVAVKSATAGLTDTGTAADAITTILNSYGMSADHAGEISDKLFAIVKRGKTTFGELAPAIGKVAATASTAGLSFDDVGASIATLTRAGISTDEAMTSINGVLTAFLKPADQAKEVAAEFGLTLDTTTLKTLGMSGVMDKLKDATAEQLAGVFPNIRGLKGMAAALGDATGFATDYNLMLESTGLTEEAFTKQSDTLEYQMKQVKQSFLDAGVSIGTVLMPIVKDLIEKYVKPLIEKLQAIPIETLTKNIKILAGVGGILLLIGAVGKLIGIIQSIGPVFSVLFSIPAGLIIAGLAAAALGIYMLVKHWDKVKEVMRGFYERFIKPWLDPLLAGLKKVVDFFKRIGEFVRGGAGQTAGGPSQSAIDLANQVGSGIPGYAKGGPINEPTLLYGLRSMRPYAIAGERGPETVSPQDNTEIVGLLKATLRETKKLNESIHQSSRDFAAAVNGLGV